VSSVVKNISGYRMKYWELKKSLRRGEIAPAYLFSGEENFLKEEALAQIKRMLFPSAWNTKVNFNYDLFYGDECDVELLIRQANTFPLLAQKRLVVVRDSEKLDNSQIESIGKYLAKPAEFTCLVMVASDKLNLKDGPFASIAKKCISVVFWKLFDREIQGWIIQQVNRKGAQITSEAAEYLHQKVGSNLSQLNNEIEKVLIYRQGEKQIGIKDIQEATGELKSNTVFDLSQAIYTRNLQEAIKILNNLFLHREMDKRISFWIVFTWNKLLEGKLLQQQGKTDEEIMQILGLKSFFERGFPDWLKNFQAEELVEKAKLITETDLEIKTGRARTPLALELLLLHLLEKRDSYHESTKS